jgi:predicted oxidoreductase
MSVDPAILSASAAAYHAIADGTADRYGRKSEKVRKLDGKLYAIQLYPVMVNTNGGPKRNADACILRNDNTPVPRLYSSGEFGSIWAWYYQGAGNISECMAVGRIAGRNAAALDSWDA